MNKAELKKYKEDYFKEVSKNTPKYVGEYGEEFVYGGGHRILVESNGPQGGDAGHGGYSQIVFQPAEAFALDVEIKENDFGDVEELMIRAKGDAETQDLPFLLRKMADMVETVRNKKNIKKKFVSHSE